MAESLGGAGFPDADAIAGLSSLAETEDLTELLAGLNEAGTEPETGTRPDQPVPGTNRGLEIDLTEDEKKILVNEIDNLIEDYKISCREKDAVEQEIRDCYAQRPDASLGGQVSGSAEMTSELLMSMVDQAWARLTTNIMGALPLIVVDPVYVYGVQYEMRDQLAKDAQAFINPYAMEDMDFRHQLPVGLKRTAKVGTCVFYVDWREERQVSYEWSAANETLGKKKDVVRKEKIVGKVHSERLDNSQVFIWPPDVVNWQRDYVFVGHETTLTPAEWRAIIRDYELGDEAVKLIESTPADTDTTETKDAERQGINNSILPEHRMVKPVTIAEVWCHMALPGKSDADKFQILLHRPSRQILWIGYNADHRQKHPYHPLRYKWSDNSAWGQGVGHEVVLNQNADTALWNLELDNLSAGAYSVILRRASSIYNTQSQNVRPGMEIPVDDVDKDFKPVKLGGAADEITPSRVANLNRAATASGLSSVMFGQGDPTMKSGAGTGSTLALIEQGNKKLQQIDSCLRVDLTSIYERIFDLIVQYGQDGVWFRQVDEEAAHRLRLLKYQPPTGDVGSFFRFRAQAPSASSSDEARKQAYMLVWSFALQYAQSISQYVEIVLQQENPAALPAWYREVVRFINAIVTKIIEYVELPGADRLVPQIPEPTPQDDIINQLNEQNTQLQQQVQQAQQQLAAFAQQGAAAMGGMGGMGAGGEMGGMGDMGGQVPPEAGGQPPIAGGMTGMEPM